jgi:GGDEF domain-containing protein
MPPGPVTQTSWSRSILFPLVGLLLAAGAPLGLLLVRLVASEARLSAAWVAADLTAQRLTYGYLVVATSLVFATLGWIVGRQEDRLRRSAITDPLTGLVNRRHWSERLAGEVDRARRYRTPLSVMILDVDELKQQNDRGGHEAGDRALCRVAEALCRSADGALYLAKRGGRDRALVAPRSPREASRANEPAGEPEEEDDELHSAAPAGAR